MSNSASRFGFGFSVAVILALLVTETVLAGCYGGHEGAAGAEGVPYRRGIKGEIDMVAATPLNSSTAIIHPTQLVVDAQNFIGWGVAKGIGVDNCPDYFGQNWQIYFDGSNDGDYFCEQHYGDVSNTAQNQNFRLEWTQCPGDGLFKFVVYWNSSWKSCKTMDISGGVPSAGSESIGTTLTQTLRVHYSAIRAENASGQWQYFTTLEECEIDAPYYIDRGGLSLWDVEQ